MPDKTCIRFNLYGFLTSDIFSGFSHIVGVEFSSWPQGATIENATCPCAPTIAKTVVMKKFNNL